MNKVIREEIISKNVFVAFDGSEFDDENKCAQYEMEHNNEAIKKTNAMLVPDMEMVPCTGNENFAEHSWKWYRITSKEELRMLEEAYPDEINADYLLDLDYLVPTEESPEIVGIEFDMEDIACGYCTKKESEDYIREFFKKLGYDIAITKI